MTASPPSIPALTSLWASAEALLAADDQRAAIAEAIDHGHFRPHEDELLKDWFARLLTVRAGLWELIADTSAALDDDLRRVRRRKELAVFLVGYAAACLVVRLDLFLVEDLATDSLVRRKLNEGAPEHRVPRKQFTAIFESLSDPAQALVMHEAMRLARRRRGSIARLADDPTIGFVVARLDWLEATLDPSKRRFFGLVASFIDHWLRRRAASGQQRTVFAAIEAGGRVASEIGDPFHSKRLDADTQRRLVSLLQPGDVVVTRHDRAFTNLFLPGYWPHAALYVGSEADRARLEVAIDPERARRWTGDRCFLEALKDGVRFRPAIETLAVDAVAVIRPHLAARDIAIGIGRAAVHEGKLYNFDFDFFRSDRLVCTEVIYRGFDGLGPLVIPLQERAGRQTLSAEDLLELALVGRMYEPVAVVGAPGAEDEVVCGAAATMVLRGTLGG